MRLEYLPDPLCASRGPTGSDPPADGLSVANHPAGNDHGYDELQLTKLPEDPELSAHQELDAGAGALEEPVGGDLLLDEGLIGGLLVDEPDGVADDPDEETEPLLEELLDPAPLLLD